METLVMIGQLILAISILVGVHEWGHFVTARMFGMRVEKFSIGFPPKIVGIKKGDTEYSIGALPLGGFVKISGMVDESMDKDQLKEEPQPYEFRSKPAWQRLIVMLGGIIVNVITGIIIFVCSLFFAGETYFSLDKVNELGITVTEMGQKIGLQNGDRIVNVNGQKVDKFNDVVSPSYVLSDNSYYTVLRGAQEVRIPITSEFIQEYSSDKADRSFIQPIYPFEVAKVSNGSEAERIGLQPGDKFVSVNDSSATYFHDFKNALANNKGQQVNLTIIRNGEKVSLEAQVDSLGRLGFEPRMILEESVRTYGVSESITQGTANAFNVIFVQLKAFRKIFSGEVSASNALSGPIGIAKIFGGTWDWARFWYLTGMLSMVLAFMNLLPIPALDGGHVVFLLYEMISGRKPSVKFMQYAQVAGMIILLALMVFAFGNDIYKLFF